MSTPAKIPPPTTETVPPPESFEDARARAARVVADLTARTMATRRRLRGGVASRIASAAFDSQVDPIEAAPTSAAAGGHR